MRQAIRDHLRFIEEEDWPAMTKGMATLRRPPHALLAAMNAILSFSPSQLNQQLAQQRALVAIEQAFEARRNQIRLSQAEISSAQWIVIIALAVLLLVTIAMIHASNPLAQAATMFIFASAVALCLVLLMIYDRPFAAGGFTMQPRLLYEVGPD